MLFKFMKSNLICLVWVDAFLEASGATDARGEVVGRCVVGLKMFVIRACSMCRMTIEKEPETATFKGSL